MTRRAQTPPPTVLRLTPGSAFWQSSARLAEGHTPPTIEALLAGRTRLELSSGEAEAAIAWAHHVPGWDERTPALIAYELGADPEG